MCSLGWHGSLVLRTILATRRLDAWCQVWYILSINQGGTE
uniref:Uncharacterized protein n=1 Tax=Siphoviridae sp. ctICF6 TaxID=2825427 RepID=A0A8S5UL87_9CAUD|nr:MAG TPA: hypothetical protein [Siphoviridae sp. ctICF6]